MSIIYEKPRIIPMDAGYGQVSIDACPSSGIGVGTTTGCAPAGSTVGDLYQCNKGGVAGWCHTVGTGAPL